MGKFKVGDEVVFLNEEGSVGKIANTIDGYHYSVNFPEGTFFCREGELELAKGKAEKGSINSKKSETVKHAGYKVIYSGTTTITIFNDGSKGVAKLLPGDTYDKFKGEEISYTKALIKSAEKEVKRLREELKYLSK
ncbi:hypothetical protein F4V43_02115 [Paenibacillus spiritus]|uniref:Uncharacterized protein n=1 Tax=Paenibacillus spiritus TaxID=2496557 RepID=A0A5J5GIH5_9BACL|nr:hypothetical protein [Paenibacillus spiritus]KAA9007304.1 hypothetical protein F4V43_02115 [Paenibacillus spiritus]